MELTGEGREHLAISIQQLRLALEIQDPAVIDAKRGALNSLIARLR